MSAPPAPAPAAEPAAQRARGYQRWRGARTAQAWRWWVIAHGNLSLALANTWVRLTLAASFIPGIIVAGITYFFLPLSPIVLDGVMDGTLIFAFLLAALVGARLVSEDRRQGAFLAHFARPVTRVDYMLGKVVALALPMFAVIVASPLLAISADASVEDSDFAQRVREVAQNIPDDQGYLRGVGYGEAIGAVVAFGIIASLTTTGIVLGLSALTTRARIAGVIWFAVVAFGAAAHGILETATRQDWPALLSWLDGLQDISSFLVGMGNDPNLGRMLEYDLVARTAVLAGAALLGLLVIHEQLRRAEGGAR